MSLEDDLLNEIYDAALDPALWSQTLHRIKVELDASLVALHSYNLATGEGFSPYSDGLDSAALAPFVEYYQFINTFREPAEKMLTVGESASDRDVVPREDLLRTEFYNDWMKPFGVDPDQLGAKVAQQDRRVTLLGTHYDPSVFTKNEILLRDKFELLAPHVTRALAISKRLWTVSQGGAAQDGVLEMLGAAAIKIDVVGRPIAMNAAAERLFDEDGFFAIERFGVLELKDAKAQKTYAQRVSAMMRKVGAATAPFWTRGADGDDQRLIWLVPLSQKPISILQTSGLLEEENEVGCALVLATSPHEPSTASADILRVAFDITDAEAHLLRSLVEGDTLDAYARRENRSLHTVRTHQKRLLQKLNVSRQKDLVAKAMSATALPLKLGE